MSRFKVDYWYDEYAIYDEDEIFATVGVKLQADKICDLLNMMSSDIEKLQSIILKQEIELYDYRHHEE